MTAGPPVEASTGGRETASPPPGEPGGVAAVDEAAAGACGATVDGIDIAGGGLLVRLDDPSLNPCFIDGLAGIEHVVSADEDMAMTAQ